MKCQFDRIHVWLAANAPAMLASLRPGATPRRIRAAEAAMGVALPEDVRAAYRIHDGSDGKGLFYGRYWQGLDEMGRLWSVLKRQHDEGIFEPFSGGVAEEGCRAGFWRPGWIPLTLREDGNMMLLDLDPAPEGKSGQMLNWWRDLTPPCRVEADSFADWIDTFVAELEAGEWVYSEEFWGLAHVEDVESLEDDE